MNVEGGGRFTLRLGPGSASRVEYDGELSWDGDACTVRVQVGVTDGRVEVLPARSAPVWLVQLVRATVRAAWRSNMAGTAWPRRINRWRPAAPVSEPS